MSFFSGLLASLASAHISTMDNTPVAHGHWVHKKRKNKRGNYHDGFGRSSPKGIKKARAWRK